MPCLLVVGNSVSEAPAKGVVPYPELLEARILPGWQVCKVIRGGKTVDELEADAAATIRANRPRALILQVGVNECGPRPLSRQERAWLGRLQPGWLRGALISLIHRYRPQIIRWRGPRSFTSLPEFQQCVRRILASAREIGCAVLILPITKVSATAEIRQPFFNREIERYNNVLRSFNGTDVRYVEQVELFGDLTPDHYCIVPESVHLDAMAHERIAAYVGRWLHPILTRTLQPACER